MMTHGLESVAAGRVAAALVLALLFQLTRRLYTIYPLATTKTSHSLN
jgi:hypothetical protein